jgi:predicted DNA-binding protein
MQSVKSTFTLPESIVRELAEFAEELGEKKSHMVAEALSQYFDRLDLEVARRRSEELREGKETTVSLEEIKAELGL